MVAVSIGFAVNKRVNKIITNLYLSKYYFPVHFCYHFVLGIMNLIKSSSYLRHVFIYFLTA